MRIVQPHFADSFGWFAATPEFVLGCLPDQVREDFMRPFVARNS